MPLFIDTSGKIPRTSPKPRPPRDESKGETGRLDSGWSDLQHAKHHRQDIGISSRLLLTPQPARRSTSCSEVDEIGLDEAVPEESVIRSLPQWL
jgi:hypothetical protein